MWSLFGETKSENRRDYLCSLIVVGNLKISAVYLGQLIVATKSKIREAKQLTLIDLTNPGIRSDYLGSLIVDSKSRISGLCSADCLVVGSSGNSADCSKPLFGPTKSADTEMFFLNQARGSKKR